MSWRKVKFRNWTFEVDLDATQESFEMKSKGSADDCSCDYCKNYREQRESIFPEEVKILFQEVGIDFTKENEVSEVYEMENGLHNYHG